MNSKKALLVTAIALSLMGVAGVALTSTEMESLTSRAESGDPSALLEAGKILLTGRGMTKDVDRGVLFLERATQIGGTQSAFAHTALAQHYEVSSDTSPQAKANMVRHYRLAAGLGDTAAQVKVARILLDTLDTNDDPAYTVQARAQARSLLDHAAKNGNVDASWELGFALTYGKGLAANATEGEEMLRRAADRGHTAASYLLASIFLQNPDTESFRPISARHYFESAANGGHPGALLKLAEGYESGAYWPKNISKGLDWATKARDASAPNAAPLYERLLAAQTVETERLRKEETARLALQKAEAERVAAAAKAKIDEETAAMAALTAKAATAATAAMAAPTSSFTPTTVAIQGAGYAMTPVALPEAPKALNPETNDSSAPISAQIQQLRAQIGMLTAQNQALRTQMDARDRSIAQLTAQRDAAMTQVAGIQTRLEQIQTASQTHGAPGGGRSPASGQAPSSIASGKNTEGLVAYRAKDYRRAARLWDESSKAGNLEAMNNLGMLHLRGFLGAVDVTQAINHFRSAADRGHATAANNLGHVYEHGVGVGRDLSRARVWYARAAELGLPGARQNLNNVDASMVARL